ncbi:lysozyme inhibitor LprI family protein [Luteimonas aquatica]|uniref:lysozyme inhibitor LprI family protein n=1 Tax=Luteimonas aquatica TaxID=450364 RepID=UPI001F583EF7|nr:lysozyme inhibitor LprI family protein [Luteimonas aquatica]
MTTIKAFQFCCLLTLCGLAACGGDSPAAGQVQAPEPAPAPAAAAAEPAPTMPADSAQPASDPSSSQEEAAAPEPQPAEDSAVLRPSYDECIGAAGAVTPAMQDCISKEYEYQDARLNKAYKVLMAKLPDAEKTKLREEERKWLAERDAACPLEPYGGQAQRLESNECALKVVAKRAAELEAR